MDTCLKTTIFHWIGLRDREVAARFPNITEAQPRGKILRLSLGHGNYLRRGFNIFYVNPVLIRYDLLTPIERFSALVVKVMPRYPRALCGRVMTAPTGA